MRLQVKRVYEEPAAGDGFRVLVDRLWPRGRSKSPARIDQWVRDVAPSNELRKWFGHDLQRWDEFVRQHFAELDRCQDAWRPLVERARRGVVTLVYAAKDEEHNNAVALRRYRLTYRRSPQHHLWERAWRA